MVENKKAMSDVKIISPHPGFQEKFVRTGVDVCVAGGAVATGKDMPLDMPVLTPDGWIRNGDLCVGDYVNTPFGNPARILQVFDHYDRQVFWMHTNDGRSVECSAEHLWAIRTKKQVQKYRDKHKKLENITVCQTHEIAERLERGEKVYIPIPDAQEFEERTFLIHPYALGVMIGDGCLTPSQWKENVGGITISNNESDVISRFYGLIGGTRIYRYKGNYSNVIYTPNVKAYRQYCMDNGLCTYSYEKRIPREYLFGSIEQRMQLLMGLMDTDGSVTDKGSFRFSTTSQGLMIDFIELCRSLGFIARLHLDNRTWKYTKGACYKIGVSTNKCIVSSQKHLSKYNKYIEREHNFIREYKHVYVTKIEKSRICDTRCILVDDPSHLYITKDYLTTHNTFGACLAMAQYLLIPGFRGIFLRNNIDDLKRGGGILDTFAELYGDNVSIVRSDNPRVMYKPTGATIEVTHVADQSHEKVEQRFKGGQANVVYFDEATGFEFETFTTIATRNRGTTGGNTQILMTTNPKRKHWLRKMVDWYIGPDGYVDPQREGRVRYFFINGKTVDDIIWGNSKEEVYYQIKPLVDEALAHASEDGASLPDDAWKSTILSFVYYQGYMFENKENMERNTNYLGKVLMAGGATAKNYLGNWDADEDDEKDLLVTQNEVDKMFLNDPQVNGDRWVSCDLADTGTDNVVMLAWDGLHIVDIEIITQSTPRENAEHLRAFAQRNNVGEGHIIYDAIRARYINDYLNYAIPFESYRSSMGLTALQYVKLKDCCYGKLISIIKNNGMSVSPEIASKVYTHQNLKTRLTIKDEFGEEIRVVRYVDAPNGKKRLMTKREMNRELGHGRSMDLLDVCAMRMMPLLNYQDGFELENSRKEYEQYKEDEENGDRVDIYDETTWY